MLCVPAAIVWAGTICISPVFAHRPWTGGAIVLFGLVAAFNLGWYFTSTGERKPASRSR